MNSNSERPFKVIFLSEWLDNPYKTLLSNHLGAYNIEVEEYLWKTYFLPIVLRSRPKILHLHALLPFIRGRSAISRLIKVSFFVIQIILIRLLGTKTVWTVHEWKDKLGTDSGNITKWQSELIGHCLYRIIVHSEPTKQDIQKAFRLNRIHKNKVRNIYHGNYIDFYKNNIDRKSARKLLSICPNSFVFLLFGGLYRYKGILDAIEAFKHLDLFNPYLLVVGKPGEKGLKKEIEDELFDNPNSSFVGERISEDEVQVYLNASNVVVLPYRVFTTSGVAVLAMSFGKACIAPNIGFFKDVPGDSGAILYDPLESESLVNAMQAAIFDQEAINQKGKHNYERAQQWDWDKVAQETIETYK